MSKQKAYVGLWVFSRDILAMLTKLIQEAESKKNQIRIIGGPEKAKLEGCVMSLQAIKESVYSMEQYGALIPGKEVTNEGTTEEDPSVVPGPEAA